MTVHTVQPNAITTGTDDLADVNGHAIDRPSPARTASSIAEAAPPLRVLLAEDHAALRQSMALVLSREPDLVVAGEAGSLAEARPQLRNADILLLDLNLPDGVGTVLIPELRAVNPRAKVLVLTASATYREVAEAMEAGAGDVLHKSQSIAEILTALRRLWAGKRPSRPSAVAAPVSAASGVATQPAPPPPPLTRREREVLRLVSAGCSDRQIAAALHISPHTATTHVKRLLHKLGVGSRTAAAATAARLGLT